MQAIKAFLSSIFLSLLGSYSLQASECDQYSAKGIAAVPFRGVFTTYQAMPVPPCECPPRSIEPYPGCQQCAGRKESAILIFDSLDQDTAQKRVLVVGLPTELASIRKALKAGNVYKLCVQPNSSGGLPPRYRDLFGHLESIKQNQ